MSYMISVRLFDYDENEEEVLHEKEGSRCRFKKKFVHKNYEIQLRLDWNNIPNKDPTLDADIKDRNTGIRLKEGRWHHTDPKFDPQLGTKIYHFQFEDLELRLSAIKTMGIDYGVSVVLKKEQPH